MEFKIFLASSMRNSCCSLVKRIIKKVNDKLELSNVKFNLIRYGETPIADHEINTQQTLYYEAATSDMLIVLVDNNIPMGKYTYGEYQAAFRQSSRNPCSRPYIKVFALYDQKNEKKNIFYTSEDGTISDFEQKLLSDSGRYVQIIQRSEFSRFFEEWLVKEALYGLGNNIKQNELSYKKHLYRIGQGGMRIFDNKYYRRDILDGQIENILTKSPIIILEGNTYSGKTRAAFEFMRNCDKWKEYDFHIYDSRYSVKELNEIKYIDYSGKNRGDVFLFDDINDILRNNNVAQEPLKGLWSKLLGFNYNEGYSLDDFGKTRIIFTVSGKLSDKEKNELYCQIFSTSDSQEFRSAIKKIRVNFDIYDQHSFQQMVNAMVRDGVLKRACIRPGNYTIGSLFIDNKNILIQVEKQYEINSALVLALAAHFKYTVNSQFTGLIDEIEELYNFICDTKMCKQNIEQLEDCIERLRREGLVVIENEKYRLHRIFVDKSILDIFNEVVIERIKYKRVRGIYAFNSILIDYAMQCQIERGKEEYLAKYHICFVTQMAYLLIDRNQLEDKEIVDLIELTTSRLLPNNEYKHAYSENTLIIDKLVDIIASYPERYSEIFASTAIANIHDFRRINNLLDICYEYSKNKCFGYKSKMAVGLYKQLVYSVLSTSNRIMTMDEEQLILSRVLDRNEDWIKPFCCSDLENVFNLARLTSYIKKMSAVQIIELLPCADSDGYDKYTMENLQDGSYEKVYLKQLSNVAIKAMCRIDSFNSFIETVVCLRNVCDKSIHVKNAIKRYFVRDFYSVVTIIVKKLNYNDRTEFFNFVFSINDEKGILDNVKIESEYVDKLCAYRVRALNELLECLDEKTALEGYQKMKDNSLCDTYTLSCLLKNDYLNFEQILRLINKDDGSFNFITLNQFMGKAETLSDANVCMRLMGIYNCDPCRIRDENALANYLKIKYIDNRRCIEIIKGRRHLYNEALSDAMINIVLKKFNIEQLVDIFFPSDKNAIQGYYFEQYGLGDEEIERIRKNAIHLNILFFRANISGKDIAELVNEKFEEIIKNEDLRKLVTDPEYNGNNCILSVYMKNRYIFHNYKIVRKFYNNLPEDCKPKKVDHNIFSVFLWYIIDAYKNNEIVRTQAIQWLNKELILAYDIFSKHYAKDDVINMMAKLYRYRPLLIDENTYNEVEEYVYERQILYIDYKEYLELLIDNCVAYVDGTFIFNALTMMKRQVDNYIYEKLATLAFLNHTGVKYDILFTKSKSGIVLSKEMQRRLFNFEFGSEKLCVDDRLVYNVSYIKVLCFLLYNEKMTFEEVEKYRERNNIPITETYLNLVFNHIEKNTIRNWKKNGCRNEVLETGYSKMINYMKKMFSTEASYLHRSIQMCHSLIIVAPNEESLNQIFVKYGFNEFENRAEIIADRMNKLLNLRYRSNRAYETISEFKNMIIVNSRNINIWAVNIYLSTFVKIAKHELMYEDNNMIEEAPLKRCWQLLKDEHKINIFELLNLDEKIRIDIIEQIKLHEGKWVLDANVQTFSYFAIYVPDIISIMDVLFYGNFTYGDYGKKSCLKDTLKNYASAYDKFKLDNTDCSLNELKSINEILLRRENYKIFNEVCDEYIIKSSYKRNSYEFKILGSFWKDLLSCQNFRIALVHYICELDIVNNVFRFDKLISLDPKDFQRINVLKYVLYIGNFDDKLKGKIIHYYDMVRHVTEKNRNYNINAELIKLIFSL